MENHLSLKGAEGVKPSVHNRQLFFNVFETSKGKREASEERETRATGEGP